VEGGAYLFAIEANGANRYHAFLFVMTIIAAVAARAIFCATNVLPETRAVLLQTLCPPATASLVAATIPPALLCKAIGGFHHRGFAQHLHLFGLVCAAQGGLSDDHSPPRAPVCQTNGRTGSFARPSFSVTSLGAGASRAFFFLLIQAVLLLFCLSCLCSALERGRKTLFARICLCLF
jgi:hypothetical protein